MINSHSDSVEMLNFLTKQNKVVFHFGDHGNIKLLGNVNYYV